MDSGEYACGVLFSADVVLTFSVRLFICFYKTKLDCLFFALNFDIKKS